MSAVTLLALAAAFDPMNPAQADELPSDELKKVATQQRGIHTMLVTLAQDGDHQFPNEPGTANPNFRMLFKKRLVDMESLFAIPGDELLQKGKPDGDIGDKPSFSKALEPGECSFGYVAGLDISSAEDLPLLIGGAGFATGWITGVDKTPPAVPFKGSVVVTNVGGNTYSIKPGPDGKIMRMKHGKLMDIFSAEYGTNPENIRLPAPAKK